MGLEARLPGTWLGGRSPTRLSIKPAGPALSQWLELSPLIRRHIGPNTTVAEVLHSFSLKGVRLVAREALLRWLNHEWPLVLSAEIPSPIELLQQQIHGHRVVTTAFAKEQLASYLHDDRDALSFLLHDLGHAEQFFRDDFHRLGQIGCYRMLFAAHQAELLFVPQSYSSRWESQLDYLIADLNTHPVHFWSVFWASARENFGPSKEHEFLRWQSQLFELWALPPVHRQTLTRPSRNIAPEAARELLDYLSLHGKNPLN